MDENVLWYRNKQVEKTIKNLELRNMMGIFVEDELQLFNKLNEFITENSVIGVGDSVTLEETGVLKYLRQNKFHFLDKYKDGLTREEKRKIYIQNFSADTFMCSTNALTEDGYLFNIDGNGSRVAPMLYGPKQVIVVTGMNKLVLNLEEAQKRVRNYAAPLDAKRLKKDTPCTKIGNCVDCKSPNRICNDFVTITGQFEKNRIKVIIIGKSFGY